MSEETNTCYLLDRYMEPVPQEDDDNDEWYEDPYATKPILTDQLVVINVDARIDFLLI